MNPELLFTELLEALCAARAWISNEPHWLASSHFARPGETKHRPTASAHGGTARRSHYKTCRSSQADVGRRGFPFRLSIATLGSLIL